MALDTALNTNSMGGIISDMTRKQVEGAEAAAGMKAAVAEETKRLRDPLLKEQEQAIGKKETQISSVGQEMMQPYVIPKETANDMATYGSMVGLIGVMLGASGKNSGMNTLSALTGLAKGYREGRKDLIDKSYKEFEVNQKRLQGLMQQAKTELDVIMQKYKVRDESVVQDIAAFEAKFANSIAGTIAKAQSADKVASLQMDIKRMEQSASQHAERIKFDRDKYNAEQELRTAQLQKAKADAQKAEREASGELMPGKGGVQQQFMAQRAVNALGGVASAMESIQKLPAGATAGILPNLQTKDGMFNFVRNSGARTLSDAQTKSIQTLYAGITRNLAAIEASGAATGLVGLSTQFEKLLPQKGDTIYDIALKTADIRRLAVENIKPLIDSGLMPPQQKQVAQQLVDRIEKTIPYTTNDVIDAKFSGRKSSGEASREIVAGTKSSPSLDFASIEDAEKAEKEGRLTKGQRVTIGGNSGKWE
jgi:hypothetical protein